MRDQRMTAQQPDFEIGQRRRFLKELVGQRRLAEIVQERGAFERGQGLRRQVEDGAEQPRHLGDAQRMGHRARIAPLHQRTHRRLHADHDVVVRHQPAGFAEIGGAAHHRVLEREAGLAILGRSLAPADGAGDGLRHGAARDRRGNLFDDVRRTLDAAAPPSGPAEHDDREILAQRFQLAGEAAGVPRRPHDRTRAPRRRDRARQSRALPRDRSRKRSRSPPTPARTTRRPARRFRVRRPECEHS